MEISLRRRQKLTDGSMGPYTFGNPPSGYFIYDSTGHASIQIMTTPPQQIASDPPTPTQALAIYNNYIAYYGTYTVDLINITVQVEGAWTRLKLVQLRPGPINWRAIL